ncbi:MAG: SPOR domain-containing protein [Epsilonproteobacteria bacterium]|nr:SPOR domain-containing protein [Campylobacterota bacterium]
MRIIWILLAGVAAFGYSLAVKEKDVQALKDLGIFCEKEGKYCVFVRGDDKERLLKIKRQVENAAISVVFLNDEKKTADLGKKKTVDKPKAIMNVFSFQFISAIHLEEARKVFKKYQNLPYIRIEKIGKFYTVRAGAYKSYEEAKRHGDYLTLNCNIIPQRIVEIKNENGYFSKK